MPKSPTIRLRHQQQEHSASCLAACVVMIAAHWQVELTEAQVQGESFGRSHIQVRIQLT